jgi:hypothetical protein
VEWGRFVQLEALTVQFNTILAVDMMDLGCCGREGLACEGIITS